MGRVRALIKVEGRAAWTLFHSGAENTYVARSLASGLRTRRLRRPRKARLAGRTHTIHEVCLLEAQIDGKRVELKAYVADRIGTDRRARRPFDVLFGAHEMQNWGITLDLKRERLDLSRYPDEFVEF